MSKLRRTALADASSTALVQVAVAVPWSGWERKSVSEEEDGAEREDWGEIGDFQTRRGPRGGGEDDAGSVEKFRLGCDREHGGLDGGGSAAAATDEKGHGDGKGDSPPAPLVAVAVAAARRDTRWRRRG